MLTFKSLWEKNSKTFTSLPTRFFLYFFCFLGQLGNHFYYTISFYAALNNIPCVVFQILGLARSENVTILRRKKDFSLAGTISTHITSIYLNASAWKLLKKKLPIKSVNFKKAKYSTNHYSSGEFLLASVCVKI